MERRSAIFVGDGGAPPTLLSELASYGIDVTAVDDVAAACAFEAPALFLIAASRATCEGVVAIRAKHPDVQIVVVGEGVEEPRALAASGVSDWIGDEGDRAAVRVATIAERARRAARQRSGLGTGALRRQLGDAEARYRTMFEHAPEGLVVIDVDRGCFVDVNDNAAKFFGMTREELLAKPFGALSTPRQPDGRLSIAVARAMNERALAGESPHYEWQFQHKSGRPILSEVRLVRLPGAQPLIRSAIVDITERKALEQRLFDAARMASVGTLAAGLAHEINNPLAYVTANVRHVRDTLAALGAGESIADDARAALLQSLDEATHGAARVQRIVADLKAFSRVDVEARAPVEVRSALELALAMATSQIRHRARVVVDQEPVPRVLANEARLGQILLNLLVNAAEAIPPGAAEGTITVTVSRCQTSRRTGGEELVEIAIADTGRGIAPQALPRIFDPFFTDKSIGEGSGLGLAICHGLVTAYGGEIVAESEVGKGTTMRVRLPIAERTSVAPPSRGAPQRRCRVLVVDDEPLVARAVARSVAAHHDVTTITKPRDALERIREGVRFDAIVCDLMMPEMSGMELFEAVLEISKEQARRMIFMTGGAFTPRARAFLEKIDNARLEKPFPPEALFSLLQGVMSPSEP